MLNQVTKINLDGKEIFLIGTAHVSKESVNVVRETIEKENPDIVAVELCEQRQEAIVNHRRWKETEITDVVKEGKSYLFLMQLLLANFQRQIGEEVGVKPGSEMIEAMNIARDKNIRVELVDRDIKITLKRAFNSMSLGEKFKLFLGLFSGIFGREEINEELIEKLKNKDVLSEVMDELSREIPSIKRVLVDERDAYIANKIAGIDAKKIVAVVGAGHVEGVKENLLKYKKNLIRNSENFGASIFQRKIELKIELRDLEVVPESKNRLKYINYLIPLSIIGIFIFGFYIKGSEFLLDSIVKWIFTTGILAAVGTALALGHPLSIITAFLVAPITTLHPLLAAGWFAGWVEAKVRKPRVKDFEDLFRINSLGDFWKNRVTRILLVISFANIGASLGTIIAGISIFAGIIPKI